VALLLFCTNKYPHCASTPQLPIPSPQCSTLWRFNFGCPQLPSREDDWQGERDRSPDLAPTVLSLGVFYAAGPNQQGVIVATGTKSASLGQLGWRFEATDLRCYIRSPDMLWTHMRYIVDAICWIVFAALSTCEVISHFWCCTLEFNMLQINASFCTISNFEFLLVHVTSWKKFVV
jgi:hypothetical protein